MKDIQKTESNHKIIIPKVGIQNFKLPITILKKSGQTQNTVADISIYVELNAEEKGTHMSRLIVGAQKFMNNKISRETLSDIAKYIANKLNTKSVELTYKFPYFLIKTSPLSKEVNINNVDVEFKYFKNNNIFKLTVLTTCTALCPCSKEISDNSAHNQRSNIKISVFCDKNNFVWIEDLVEIANSSCSCQTYSVLKRLDEKFVTEKAYHNPKFVEDIVREIYDKLLNINIDNFEISVTNHESIHQHNAYAFIEHKNNFNLKEKY